MSDIVIFKNGEIELSTKVENESIWITQKQMAELFNVKVPAISKHIKNIIESEELDSKATISKMETVQKEGNREIKREREFYNLDMIISIGYRVNSKKATIFRQWATKTLKRYIINGYALNKDRLQQQKLNELTQTLHLIQLGLNAKELSTNEAKGFAEIISNYAKSWALLQGYDDQSLQEIAQTIEQKFILDLNEAKEAIKELKKALLARGEATELFGQEKANELKGNLLNIYQSFGGVELLPSVEQKAANLLYYIIKGHPFNDGNKRIGAYLFVLFLHRDTENKPDFPRGIPSGDGSVKIREWSIKGVPTGIAVPLSP